MKALTEPMRRELRRAPDDWQKLHSDGPSIDALRKRGLIELRDQPGEAGPMAGFQWRITDTGRIIDNRDDGPEDEGAVERMQAKHRLPGAMVWRT